MYFQVQQSPDEEFLSKKMTGTYSMTGNTLRDKWLVYLFNAYKVYQKTNQILNKQA